MRRILLPFFYVVLLVPISGFGQLGFTVILHADLNEYYVRTSSFPVELDSRSG
jgi:hypothetical protein